MTGFNPAEFSYQLMMGVSLAACAGFRAWLPLFIMGIMARANHVHLNPSFDFLMSDGMLTIFGIASVLDLLGDKFIAVDHFLDAVGTIARPVAGTLLASSMLTKIDPSTALLIGLIAGGGTALTVHAGKTVTRAKASVFAPLHLGTANAGLSIIEDVVSFCGIWLALLAPYIAIFFVMILLLMALGMVYLAYKTGKKVFHLVFGRRNESAPVAA